MGRNQPIIDINPFARVERDYTHNLLVRTDLRNIRFTQHYSLSDNQLLLGLIATAHPPSADLSEASRSETLALYLRRFGQAVRPPRRPAGHLRRNVDLVARVASLSAVEARLLELLVALRGSRDLVGILGYYGHVSLSSMAAVLAAAICVPTRDVQRALSRSGRLIESGLLAVRENMFSRDLTDRLELVDSVLEAIHLPDLDRAKLLERFLPIAEASKLAWSDFEHLGDRAELARDILAAAVAARVPGVNILFHGETGTGKTELARLLAGMVGAKLFVAGLADDTGNSPSPGERLASLSLGHRLVPRGGSVLLFDELEDLFSWGPGSERSTSAMSKQWFNRLLETNPVPTVWLTNRIRGIDRAFLRRFTHVVELRAPGARQRARILDRHLGKRSALAAADVAAVAARFAASPADLGAAVATARLLGRGARVDRPTLERVLGPREGLLGAPTPPAAFDAATYRPAAANASVDLAALADRLASRPTTEPLSLCLYGPPGTGKSAFVRYLAHRMGRPVLCKSASDILGSLVGATEHAIARAFQQAEDEGAVLLLDEVDSFLRDRRGARQTWEVTQVNELLQRLESFRGVVACTTNLWKDLDEASVRRFVLKIEFRPATPAQALELFEAALPGRLPAARRAAVSVTLARLTALTPGDFAIVACRLRVLHDVVTPELLLRALEEEAAAKPRETRRAGFA